MTPEQLPQGSFVSLRSYIENGVEVVNVVIFDGEVLPAFTPTPAPGPPPTATPVPPRPTPTPVAVLPSVSGYPPLLAEAASSLPTRYDFIRDGLSAPERELLDWADTRLFSNENFLQSKWGPDNWPADLRVASTRAVILLMREINIQKESNGHHVVSWERDSLDRVLDDLDLYPGMCTHCYGKTGYDTIDGIDENYAPIIRVPGHVHREMLKTFAYLAKADGEDILVRSLMENSPEDFELLYKRSIDKYPNTITAGSFSYENVSFMSQIELPDGTLVSYPTMAYGMVGSVDTEREGVERVYDYMRTKLVLSQLGCGICLRKGPIELSCLVGSVDGGGGNDGQGQIRGAAGTGTTGRAPATDPGGQKLSSSDR